MIPRLDSVTVLLACVVTLSSFRPTRASVPFPSEVEHLVEAGKQQYGVLHERTKVPNYGECWKSAIQNLHEGCQALTEDVQSDIALGFMNCFLKMSGHETYNCHYLGGTARRECLQGMSDRAFNVYTEFYTHTQSICFYLRSQIWQEETDNTINRLTSASDKATNQLEDLVDNTQNLKQALVDSHVNLKLLMQEFHDATLEQKRLLFDVFDRLSSLQEWAVGEISWLDTVVFYLCGMIVSHVLTATSRTQGARLLLFFAFSANILAERYLCQYLVSGSMDKIDTLNENLAWYIWWCRKILVTVCCLILGVTAYWYRDYNLIFHSMLQNIQQQNSKLLDYLERIEMLKGSVPYLPASSTSGRTHIDMDAEYEKSTKQSGLLERSGNTSVSSDKLYSPSPRTAAAVLNKTEQVITSALQSSFVIPEHLEIMRRTPSPSRSSTRSSTSSRGRKKLVGDTAPRGRYNLRSPKLENGV